MAQAGLKAEERFGLVAAVVLHAGLAAVLLLRPAPRPLPLPERITVNLSEVVGLTSTAPEPEAKAAPEAAPKIGESAPPPPPEVKAVVKPVVQPKVVPAPLPLPKPALKPEVRPKPKPAPKPAPMQYGSRTARHSGRCISSL